MSLTSYKLPTSIIANGVGVNSWTTPNNILLVNGEFASTSNTTNEMTVGTFNLNIPDDSTITNFYIKVKGYRGAFDTSLQIYALDVSTGATYAYPATVFQGFSGANVEYTLPATSFGTTWTSDQANSIQLKLVADGELHLDAIQLEASYVANIPVTPVAPSIGEDVIDEFVQAQEFQLAQSMTSTDTFMYLESFNLPNGEPIQIADFQGSAMLTIDKGVPLKEENVLITNVEHNYNGTGLVKLDFTSTSNRGLGFIYPYTSVSGNIRTHVGTATVVISNSAPFYDRFLKKNQINALVSAPIYVQDESSTLPDPLHTLDFQGAGVSVVNDGSDSFKKIVTINGTGVNPAVVVTTSSSTSGASQVPDLTWQHVSSGVNRLLIVQVSTESANTITGITFNGIALTEGVTDTNGVVREEQWYLIAPPVGAYNIVITMSADSFITAGAESYMSANQATPIGATMSATGTDTTPTLNIITTVDNSTIVDGVATSELPIVYTLGAGQTSNWSITANPNTFQGASSTEPSGANPDTVTMSYALTQSTDWVMTALEVIGISGTAGGVQSVVAGTNVTVDNTDPANPIVSATGGGSGSANEVTETITQVAHGFAVGDVIRSSGVDGEYTKAQANSAKNAQVTGIVTAVVDADNFTYGSVVLGLTGAYVPSITAGNSAWLSPTVAGAMTATKPTAVGQVRKPLGTVTSDGAVMNFDADQFGELITSSTSGATGFIGEQNLGGIDATGTSGSDYSEIKVFGSSPDGRYIYVSFFAAASSNTHVLYVFEKDVNTGQFFVKSPLIATVAGSIVVVGDYVYFRDTITAKIVRTDIDGSNRIGMTGTVFSIAFTDGTYLYAGSVALGFTQYSITGTAIATTGATITGGLTGATGYWYNTLTGKLFMTDAYTPTISIYNIGVSTITLDTTTPRYTSLLDASYPIGYCYISDNMMYFAYKYQVALRDDDTKERLIIKPFSIPA